MYQQKGSITIFALLAMLLVMTTLFTFLEFTRFQNLKGLTVLQTETALESLFANYSSYLWEHYHLLGCDIYQIDTIITEIGNSRYDRNSGRNNLLLFQVEDVEVEEYTLLTDGEGTAYMHAVADYMEKHILYETVKEIFNQYEAVKNLKENSMLDLSKIDTALEKLEETKSEENPEQKETKAGNSSVLSEAKLEQENPSSVGSSKQKDLEVNPLEEIKRLQKTGILELVLEDTKTLSEKTISLTGAVSNRSLAEGNQVLEETDWLDKIWLQQYFLQEMSYFCDIKKNHGLSYEVEYLIGGKESDYANLKVVVTELLLIREVSNFLYLMSDVKKVEEAGILAMTLVGGSANPVLIEAVKMGLLTAWAFGESILDVRALLQNKSIPLIKNESLWTLELDNLGGLSQEYMTAKEAEWGLSYKDYLGILLLFQSENTLAMRGMDVQEITIQKLYGNTAIRMDELMTKAKVRVVYAYSPVFFSIEGMDPKWNYEISTIQDYGYY